MVKRNLIFIFLLISIIVNEISLVSSVGVPTVKPTSKPSLSPTVKPSNIPTLAPTSKPSSSPTLTPTKKPTPFPTQKPSNFPTTLPTFRPSSFPTVRPTSFPTIEPTIAPSVIPTILPSPSPSIEPSPFPSSSPTLRPSRMPTIIPTFVPTGEPTVSPSVKPSSEPTTKPSAAPSTFLPTSEPTVKPSFNPTPLPTQKPTLNPTFRPSMKPTTTPTSIPTQPSAIPTARPTTSEPTFRPTRLPTTEPSDGPSPEPTTEPTSPSATPTLFPTPLPSLLPTFLPTSTPSFLPTSPSSSPSFQPTTPSTMPTAAPTSPPTVAPSRKPTTVPTYQPSRPTVSPTFIPSARPSTMKPSSRPSSLPSPLPSPPPTPSPTTTPSRLPTPQPTRPTSIPTPSPTFRPTSRPTSLSSVNDPILLSYSIDLSFGLVTLTFDRLVSSKSFDPTGVTLQSTQVYNASTTVLQPLSGVYPGFESQGNVSVFSFYFTSTDYAKLRFKTNPLTKSLSTTFLTISRGAIRSNLGFDCAEIFSSLALQANSFVLDTQPPTLISFNFSMDSGVMRLVFSEPLDTSTFTLNGLALQSKINAYSSGDYLMLNNSGSSPIVPLNYDRIIQVNLGNINLNRIKATIGLCIDEFSCFLSAWRPIVTDVAGVSLSLETFSRVLSVGVLSFVPDITPPTLLGWEFNFNTGIVRLFLSETIYIDSFNYSKVILSSSSNVSSPINILMPIVNPVNPIAYHTDIIPILLSDDQLNYVKSSDLLCRYSQNCFLILEKDLVHDTSYRENRYLGIDASLQSPRPVTLFSFDTISPVILSFSLNMTSQTITFYLSEVVRQTSIDVRALTLQSTSGVGLGTEVFRFTQTSVSILSDGLDHKFVTLQFTPTTFSILKSNHALSRSPSSTYLAVTSSFLTDRAPVPNLLSPISTARALQVSNYFPDLVPPYLESWYPNMSSNELILTFSEPMDLSSFSVTGFTLLSDSMIFKSTMIVQLSNLSRVTDSLLLNTYYAVLSTEDSTAIKKKPPLATTLETSYFSILPGTAFDASTLTFDSDQEAVKHTNPVLGSPPLPPSTFFPDKIPPTLKSYTVNMNTGILSLTFDEPVKSQNFDPSRIDLMDLSINGTGSIRLSSSDYTDTSDSETFNLVLCRQDFIRLKRLSNFFLHNIYLTLSSLAVKDMAGNWNLARNQLGSSNFIIDKTSPTLQALYMRDRTRLTVYFNDLIQTSTVLSNNLVLVSEMGTKLALGAATLLTPNSSDTLVYDLSSLYSKMQTSRVGTSQTETNIYITVPGSILDIPNYNPISRIPSNQPIREGNQFISFQLDMTVGKITLQTVFPFLPGNPKKGVSVVSPGGFFIVSNLDERAYPLTAPLSFDFSSDNFMNLYLNAKDMETLQVNLPMSSKSDVSILILSTAVQDALDQKKFLGMDVTLPCSSLFLDTTPPLITSSSLHMGLGLLNLTFSEPIKVASIDPSVLRLVNNRFQDNRTVSISLARLTVVSPVGKITSTTSSTFLSLSLNSGPFPTIRDQIHLSNSVGLGKSSALLLIGKGFLSDFSKNYLVEITNATEMTQFVSDRIPPVITRFDLDMNLRKMVLTFSEAINLNSNVVSKYTLYGQPINKYPIFRTLQYSTTVFPSSVSSSLVGSSVVIGSSYVEISLDPRDVDAMMELCPNLALSSTNSFLAYLAAAIFDLATTPNAVQLVEPVYAIPPTSFVLDTTPPVLLYFDFDLQNGLVDFYFNEIMDCKSTQVNLITLQYSVFVGSLAFQASFTIGVTTPDCVSFPFSRHIRLVIGYEDLIRIKATSSLMKTRDRSFLRLGNNAFRDSSGNGNNRILDGFALPVRNHTMDTVPPRLLSFTINSQQSILMYFDEPVNPASLSIPSIVFQDSSPSPSTSFFLSKAIFVSTNPYSTILNVLLGGDYGRITTTSNIFKSQATTWMRLLAGGVSDFSGNGIGAIPVSMAVMIGPRITSWEINMRTGLFRVYPSEDLTRLAPVGMKIQSSSTLPANQSYFLRTATSMTSAIYPFTGVKYFETYLSRSDLNNLQYRNLSTSAKTAFLSSMFGLSTSVDRATMIPRLNLTAIPTSAALPMQAYYPDTSSPTVLYFNLDLNVGDIEIVFNKPVLVSSLKTGGLTLYSSTLGYAVQLGSEYNPKSDFPKPNRTSELTNMTTIRVYLFTDDLNNLKFSSFYGKVLNNLLITSDSISDFNGNWNLGNNITNPYVLNVLRPDLTPPAIVKFRLDMSEGTMYILFSEYISLSSLAPANITLSSSSNISQSGTVSVTLSSYSLVLRSTRSEIKVDFGLYFHDELAIEAVDGLATQMNNTYLLIDGVADIFGNFISEPLVRKVDILLHDRTPMRLLSASLISFTSTTADFIFYFSKIPSELSFSCSDFFLSDTSTSASKYSSLSGSDCSLIPQPVQSAISFRWTPSSSNSTSLFTTIFSASSPTPYFSAPTPTSTEDNHGNYLEAIPLKRGMGMGPRVVKFSIDMNSRMLNLVFSQTLNVSVDEVAGIVGLYSTITKKSYYLTSDSSLSHLYDPVLISDTNFNSSEVGTVSLSLSDLNEIKSLDVGSTSLYLLLKGDLLSNQFGESLVPRTYVFNGNDNLLVTSFFPDTIPPTISSISFSLGTGVLSFSFDEPIRASSVRLSNIVLQSSASSATHSLRLSSSGSVEAIGVKLLITLSIQDMAILKLNPVLAMNSSDTFLSLTYQTIADMSNNYLESIPSTHALQIGDFFADDLGPRLLSYILDMDEGVLSLYFNEPVRISNFDPTQITFQSRFARKDGTYYTLTGGALRETSDTTDLHLILLDLDVNSMKNSVGLVRSLRSTFLTATSTLCQDLFGNQMFEIYDGEALPASSLVPDTTPPRLMSSILDLDASSISLRFSELVVLDTVQPKYLTFQLNSTLKQSFSNNILLSYTLRTTKVKNVEQVFSDTVLLLFSPADLNSLKSSYPLLSSASTTYITFTSTFLLDTFSNPVIPIPNSNAFQVSTLLPDTVNISLVSIDLDMSAGLLTMEFSEAVNIQSVDLSEIVLQSCLTRRFCDWLTLSDCVPTVFSGAESVQLTITLTPETQIRMKARNIGTSMSNTYISYSDRFLSDYSGLYLKPIWDHSVNGFSPRHPDTYAPDALTPSLTRWFINREASPQQLWLFFDEPSVLLNSSSFFLVYSASEIGEGKALHPLPPLNLLDLNYQNDSTVLVISDKRAGLGQVCANTDTCLVKFDFFAHLTQDLLPSPPLSLYLATYPGSFKDYSVLQNENLPIRVANMKQEGTPDCSACPSDYFLSSPCTSSKDRVCSVCSACPYGYFEKEECQGQKNTVCGVCSPCPFGSYISSECSSSSDTLCSPCSSCNNMQYVDRKCQLGKDTICGSCAQCSFSSPWIQSDCEFGLWRSWAFTHCCVDSEGNRMSCSLVGWKNLQITARNSRHHWVFPDSSPPVTEYEYRFGQTY